MSLYAQTNDPLSNTTDDTTRNNNVLCHDDKDGWPWSKVVSGRRKDASQYEMNEKFRFFLLTPHSPKGDKITLPYSSCKCHVWDQYTTVVYSRLPKGNITHIFDGWGYVLCCIVLARSEGPTHMSSGRRLPLNNLGNLRRMTESAETLYATTVR